MARKAESFGSLMGKGLRFDYLLRKSHLNLDPFNHPVFTKTDGPDSKTLEADARVGSKWAQSGFQRIAGGSIEEIQKGWSRPVSREWGTHIGVNRNQAGQRTFGPLVAVVGSLLQPWRPLLARIHQITDSGKKVGTKEYQLFYLLRK